MSIPNVATLYQKIAKGSEGGHEFARFVRMLLIAEFNSQKKDFISESDASGDYKKLDAYLHVHEEFRQFVDGFQFKFYPTNLSAGQRNEIQNSIEAALEENQFLQRFILVTPEDFMKEQYIWFDTLKSKYENSYWAGNDDLSVKCNFKLDHWGHTKLVELSLKHDHIGVHYYPELYPFGVGKFKLAQVTLTGWIRSKHNINGYYLPPHPSNNPQTTDPVFDFQFKNSTGEIHLLHKIEIHIEEVWTVLKGFSADELLKSIGTIEHEVDFTQPINTITLSDPLIFPPKTPKRFKLQLKNFNPPGNWVRLKFWFYFDEITIPTDTFSLGL